MSGSSERIAALLAHRCDAGIMFCVRKFGHERVMAIQPETIEVDSAGLCLFAQAANLDYHTAVKQYGLTEAQELAFGFVGDFDMPATDGDTRTEEITPVCRERLRLYQAAHVPA